jgi:hypothetical protein
VAKELEVTKDKKVDVLQYDKRVMHRYLAEGKISQKEAESHLANLKDMSNECDDIADVVYGDKHMSSTEAA